MPIKPLVNAGTAIIMFPYVSNEVILEWERLFKDRQVQSIFARVMERSLNDVKVTDDMLTFIRSNIPNPDTWLRVDGRPIAYPNASSLVQHWHVRFLFERCSNRPKNTRDEFA